MWTERHTKCTDLVSKSHKVQGCIFRINRLGKQQASLFLFLVLTLIPCDVFVAFKITYMGPSIAAIRRTHTVVDNWALVDVGELSSSSPNKKVGLGFPGGAVVENLPANAGDTGLSPGLGRSHMPRSN